MYEWVDGEVASIYHGNRRFLTALALTLFTWIVAMNTMDLLPLDAPGKVAGAFGAGHWRVLPTADINGTAAMAVLVLLLVVGGRNTVQRSRRVSARVDQCSVWLSPAVVDSEPGAQRHRASGQAGFAGDAVVRQHVRGAS